MEDCKDFITRVEEQKNAGVSHYGRLQRRHYVTESAGITIKYNGHLHIKLILMTICKFPLLEVISITHHLRDLFGNHLGILNPKKVPSMLFWIQTE